MFNCIKKLFQPKYPSVLQNINTFVNNWIRYETDNNQYGKSDVWVVTPLSRKGDCEDYVLTKQVNLINSGIPKEDLQLMLCRYKGADGKVQGHAVLLYKGEWVLDNRTDVIWRKKQTEYYDWQLDNKKRDIHVGKP